MNQELAVKRSLINIANLMHCADPHSRFAFEFWDGEAIAFGNHPEMILRFRSKEGAKHLLCNVLADEPTANLDSVTADGLMELFRDLNERHGTTFVIATHDKRVMSYARRLVRMLDGHIVDDVRQDAA